MKTILLAAGAAATLLTAGSALGAPKHPATGGAVAAPRQPIPYAQLNSYLKASPSQRAKKDWWSGASTGVEANASARAPSPAMANDPPTAGADMPAPPAAAPMDNTMPMDKPH